METKIDAGVTLEAIQAANPNEGLLNGRRVKIHILYQDYATAERRRLALKRAMGTKKARLSLSYWEHANAAARAAVRLRRALGIAPGERVVIPLVSRLLASRAISEAKAEDRKARRCLCGLTHPITPDYP